MLRFCTLPHSRCRSGVENLQLEPSRGHGRWFRYMPARCQGLCTESRANPNIAQTRGKSFLGKTRLMVDQCVSVRLRGVTNVNSFSRPKGSLCSSSVKWSFLFVHEKHDARVKGGFRLACVKGGFLGTRKKQNFPFALIKGGFLLVSGKWGFQSAFYKTRLPIGLHKMRIPIGKVQSEASLRFICQKSGVSNVYWERIPMLLTKACDANLRTSSLWCIKKKSTLRHFKLWNDNRGTVDSITVASSWWKQGPIQNQNKQLKSAIGSL